MSKVVSKVVPDFVQGHIKLTNAIGIVALLILSAISLSVGVADFSWQGVWQSLLHFGLQVGSQDNGSGSSQDAMLLLISRLPRTLAIILTGMTLSVSGLILQVVLKNRFVEPSMVGATQSATLGLLLVSLFAPQWSPIAKMSISSLTALLGMGLFVLLIRRLPSRDYLLIPLVGIVYGGIITGIATFIGYQTEMLQTLAVWFYGDFSAVLAGRYELLWLTGGLTVLAYLLADKLNIVGLGDTIAMNLGVNQRTLIWLSMTMVAMMSAMVVVTVGAIPFVGLVVPNVVSRLYGDHMRQSLPTVALLGACAVLFCDILGRIMRYPFEIPVATIFGVLGAVVFLWLMLKPVRQTA